jgi:hypothetical protein
VLKAERDRGEPSFAEHPALRALRHRSSCPVLVAAKVAAAFTSASLAIVRSRLSDQTTGVAASSARVMDRQNPTLAVFLVLRGLPLSGTQPAPNCGPTRA